MHLYCTKKLLGIAIAHKWMQVDNKEVVVTRWTLIRMTASFVLFKIII